MANTRSFKPKTAPASDIEEIVGAPAVSSEVSAPVDSERGDAPRRDYQESGYSGGRNDYSGGGRSDYSGGGRNDYSDNRDRGYGDNGGGYRSSRYSRDSRSDSRDEGYGDNGYNRGGYRRPENEARDVPTE